MCAPSGCKVIWIKESELGLKTLRVSNSDS